MKKGRYVPLFLILAFGFVFSSFLFFFLSGKVVNIHSAYFAGATLFLYVLIVAFYLFSLIRRSQIIDSARKAHGSGPDSGHGEDYRALVEGLTDVVMRVSLDGRLEYCSPAVKEFGGYDAEEEIGNFIGKYFARKEDLFKSLDLIKKIAFEHKAAAIEFLYQPKDRTPFYVEVTGSPIVRGGTTAIYCVMRDVQEHKNAEAQIRKLSLAVEQSPASVVITNTKGEIEYVNPKFTQLTGYTFEEVKGQNPRFLKSGHTDPEEYKHMWEIIANGKEWRGEFHNRKKSGELYWEIASISPVKDTGGKITHYIAIKEDITLQKQTHEELKKAYEEVKSVQEQLVQSEKMAALGRFSSGVAHEVKNPLAIILSGLEYLEKKLSKLKMDEDTKEVIATTKEAIVRANSIVLGLLAFARPSELKLETLDPKELVENGISFMKGKATIAKVSIRAEHFPDQILIHVDRSRIQQALLNLIINAVDAMPKGGEISIRTYKTNAPEFLDGNEACVIEISDEGMGISEENLIKIFEPFFTTKRGLKGTGLGLAMTKGIIERHNGKISVTSKAGKGTTFRIVLPVSGRRK